MWGGEGNDGIFGGDGNDWGSGGDGNDHLTGAAGDDFLYGDDDDDHLEGGDGHDKLIGGEGQDSLEGGYGNDRLEGGNGDDRLNSGGGDNLLLGGEGNDYLSTGGAGAWLGPTTLDGGPGNDTYMIVKVSDTYLVDDVVPTVVEFANQGYDTIHLGSSFFNEMSHYNMPQHVERLVAFRSPAAHLAVQPDELVRIVGNSMDNIIMGTAEDDVLDGGEGHDIVYSRDPSEIGRARIDGQVWGDSLYGGAGNDRMVEVKSGDVFRMYGGAGDDIYEIADGGYTGSDTRSYDGWMAQEGANQGYDIVKSQSAKTLLTTHVEGLIYTGKAAQTHLLGNTLNNSIHGGADSADRIEGLDGNDVLDGGVGDGNDTLRGGTGDDTLYGWGGNDGLYGGANNDYIHAGRGIDYLEGNEGNDSLNGEEGDDWMYGGTGVDRLYGGADNDWLDGGDGNDTMDGGAGNDILVGGEGSDTLTGGNGADRFAFRAVTDSTGSTAANPIFAFDRITDFVKGQDLIDLSWIDAKTGVAGDQPFAFAGVGSSQLLQPGMVHAYHLGDATKIVADVNGDFMPDVEIMLAGIVHLTADDFVM
jgi:Ca2+-binding RTX toxin-like protein